MIAASSINYIGLIIVAVIWILSALFKRKEDTSTELPPELQPRRGPPAAPPAAANWEEELRRVLGQSTAEPPPPPVIAQPARPVFRSVVAAPPPRPGEMEEHLEVSLPVPQPQIEPAFQPLAGLTESPQHFAEAASLHERVQQHMHDLTTHRAGSTAVTSVGPQGVAPEYRELVKAFHNPAGARSAIVASVIFGPPRGLEPL